MSETFDKSQMSETIDVPAGCSGVTPADLTWWPVWQPNCPLSHPCEQALMGLRTGIYRASDECFTD